MQIEEPQVQVKPVKNLEGKLVTVKYNNEMERIINRMILRNVLKKLKAQ